MKNLPTIRNNRTSTWLLRVVIAAAIVITVAGTTAIPRPASADNHDPPDLRTVSCFSDGNLMVWRTGNDGQIETPEGWKVERTQKYSSGTSSVRAFTFIGSEADALLSNDEDYWIWVDEGADRNLPYTYRVRAINADGSEMDGRTWSRSAPIDCFSETSGQPGISLPACECDGFAMLWRTSNGGQAEAPDGWKVERIQLDSEGTSIVRTFTFTGAEADSLRTPDDRYWQWVDKSVERNLDYSYRVRAINSDESDMDDREWSRSVSATCLSDILNQPGISVPRRQGNEVSMFWHTRDRGQADAPDGWKVERRHWDSEGWGVETFTFTGADADALQTFNEQYWDWVDTTADQSVAYTYRVRAINSDGSDMSDRVWSRRAPVES